MISRLTGVLVATIKWCYENIDKYIEDGFELLFQFVSVLVAIGLFWAAAILVIVFAEIILPVLS